MLHDYCYKSSSIVCALSLNSIGGSLNLRIKFNFLLCYTIFSTSAFVWFWASNLPSPKQKFCCSLFSPLWVFGSIILSLWAFACSACFIWDAFFSLYIVPRLEANITFHKTCFLCSLSLPSLIRFIHLGMNNYLSIELVLHIFHSTVLWLYVILIHAVNSLRTGTTCWILILLGD
jgi:hypothetical protein